jgi:hypothetical protein
LHQLVGSENIDALGAIQKYFHKANIIRQEYLDYVKTILPIMYPRLDDMGKKDLMNTIWEIQFGEEKENTLKTTQKAYEDIKSKFKEIITLEGEELYSNESNKLNSFNEWMK